MITKTNQEMFRTSTLRQAPINGVDRGKNVIRGAKVLQKGPVNDDRPFEVDDESLQSVVAYGNRLNKGLKARFTHPNMSDDGMGRYLGRWKDFRIEGDSVLADLHIADVAFDTPHGDLGGYVMDLAEEDPEAFGVSLASVLDEAMFAVPEAEDDDEEEVDAPPKSLALRFKKLYAADVVDEPAATRGGLFDVNTPQGLPYQVTWIMDHFFKDAKQEEVLTRFQSFLRKYYRGDFSMNEEQEPVVAEAVADEAVEDSVDVADEATPEEVPAEVTAETTETVTASDLSAGREYVELFGERGALWFIEGKSLTQCYSLQITSLREQVSTLEADNADLRSRLDAALKTAGEEEALSSEPEMDAAKRKLAKKQEKVAEAKKKGASEAVAAWSAMYDKE